uniref:Uncharacterized protein n=1 Tax=Parascaris equorum TaxID=6256 RepID=A0A914RNA8_PAREQ
MELYFEFICPGKMTLNWFELRFSLPYLQGMERLIASDEESWREEEKEATRVDRYTQVKLNFLLLALVSFALNSDLRIAITDCLALRDVERMPSKPSRAYLELLDWSVFHSYPATLMVTIDLLLHFCTAILLVIRNSKLLKRAITKLATDAK